MTYMTSVERLGRAAAIQESIVEVLEARFDNVPPELVEQLNQIYDIDWLKQAIITELIAEFQQQLLQENRSS